MMIRHASSETKKKKAYADSFWLGSQCLVYVHGLGFSFWMYSQN